MTEELALSSIFTNANNTASMLGRAYKSFSSTGRFFQLNIAFVENTFSVTSLSEKSTQNAQLIASADTE